MRTITEQFQESKQKTYLTIDCKALLRSFVELDQDSPLALQARLVKVPGEVGGN
jgi:hypothetical protein